MCDRVWVIVFFFAMNLVSKKHLVCTLYLGTSDSVFGFDNEILFPLVKILVWFDFELVGELRYESARIRTYVHRELKQRIDGWEFKHNCFRYSSIDTSSLPSSNF